MNRQVLPSMLLSVFIVCFFAVVLRPIEPPGGRPQDQASPAAPTEESAPPAGDSTNPQDSPPSAPPPAPASSQPSPPADQSSREEPAAAEAETSPARAPASASVSAVVGDKPVVASPAPPAVRPGEKTELIAAAAATSPTPSPAPAAAPTATAAVPSKPVVAHTPAQRTMEAPVRLASTPTPKRAPPVVAPEPDVAPRIVTPEPVAPEPEAPVTIPRGEPESTVSTEGETLEDVAIRVYGTPGALDTLRQANPEVESRRGALRNGTLLWTPPR
ncbi:hypothetical protein [Paludisphaera rhizosphaerae]|uniref:hypothetical protein n=1 Tax=Paludisphaera rhizosphaerae TaxID=2711216 RepID=UPI0013ECBDC1|nr:hypothetical protein [Paludisphaera rhizosphaerae]